MTDRIENKFVAKSIGRPSKLTPERIERLCAALRLGHTRATAAALAGLSSSTVYSWLAIAGRDDAPADFSYFLEAVKAAEIEAEDALLQIILKAAASGTWTAAAWILERRRPESWSKHSKLEMTAPPTLNQSAVERHMEEAGQAADLALRLANYARLDVPLAEYDDEARTHLLESQRH